VLSPPGDLDGAALLRVLDEQYGVTASHLEFQPVGQDSWCYRAGPLWVSVRRDLHGHVPAAYQAAAQLPSVGLEFVLAPLCGADGCATRQVGGYPIVVFPYLDVTELQPGAVARADAEAAVLALSRLHGAEIELDVPVEDYGLCFDDDLDLALEVTAARRLDSGPFGERLRQLLSSNRALLERLRGEYGCLARSCAGERGELRLTHGEPLISNFLTTGERLLVADWGELMWGPPERDWSHVIRTLGIELPCRPDFKRLYDLRWILSEIAEYAAVFAAPHTDSSDASAMWERLLQILPG
jgi:spectinomycin phosphotransferase